MTSSSALDAARQTARFLERRHLYADLNSVSPAVKREIRRVIPTRPARRFVEAAVMAPVLPYGHRVPMLLGGDGADAFIEAMTPLGMRTAASRRRDVGTAAAVKMCRSIVVKGLEALLCECVLGASRFEADDHVFASLKESYPGTRLEEARRLHDRPRRGARRAPGARDGGSRGHAARHWRRADHGRGHGETAGLERAAGF